MGDRCNIILIGMPGAGKSTIGVLLAKSLGLAFEDTDLLIQQHTCRKLQELIEIYGVSGFLKIEANELLDLNCSGTVIATGGSAVYSEAAMKHLAQNGVMVYLKLDYSELQQRVTNMATRGIVIGKNQSLRQLYEERQLLYERYADIIVETTGLSIEESLVKLVALLGKN